MRKVFLLAISCLCSCISFIANADELVDLLQEPVEGDGNDLWYKGHRMPPAPVICFIDFEQGTITGDAPVLATVSSYQLMDAEGTVTIASSPLAADILSYVTASPGETFTLRLVTPTIALRGLISAE